MNPLTNVKNINKINEIELRKGYVNKKSWHDEYKDSAWVFIGGLPYDLTEGDVLCVFSQYGEIVNLNLVRDKKTGKSKGYCFLCYANQISTRLAVDNLNGIKLLQRTIRVDHVANYKPPKDNENDDEITQQLKAEGCAPKPIKQEESSDELEVIPSKKKQKKSKKEKKKRKKVKKEKQDVADGTRSIKIKKEKIDPGYSKYEITQSKSSVHHATRSSSRDSCSSSSSSASEGRSRSSTKKESFGTKNTNPPLRSGNRVSRWSNNDDISFEKHPNTEGTSKHRLRNQSSDNSEPEQRLRHDSSHDSTSKQRKRSESIDSSKSKKKKRHDNSDDLKSMQKKRHDSSDDSNSRHRKRHDSGDDSKSKKMKRHDPSDDSKSIHKKRHDSGDDSKSKHRKRHDSSDDSKSQQRKRHESSDDDDSKSKQRKRHYSSDDSKSKLVNRNNSGVDSKSKQRKRHDSNDDSKSILRKRHDSGDDSKSKKKKWHDSSDESEGYNEISRKTMVEHWKESKYPKHVEHKRKSSVSSDADDYYRSEVSYTKRAREDSRDDIALGESRSRNSGKDHSRDRDLKDKYSNYEKNTSHRDRQSETEKHDHAGKSKSNSSFDEDRHYKRDSEFIPKERKHDKDNYKERYSDRHSSKSSKRDFNRESRDR